MMIVMDRRSKTWTLKDGRGKFVHISQKYIEFTILKG